MIIITLFFLSYLLKMSSQYTKIENINDINTIPDSETYLEILLVYFFKKLIEFYFI